jgi:Protein of unknown function (DUF3616)
LPLGRRRFGGRLSPRKSSDCQPDRLPDAPEQWPEEPVQNREEQEVGEEDADGSVESKLVGDPTDGRGDERGMGETDVEDGEVADRADGHRADIPKDPGRIYSDDAGVNIEGITVRDGKLFFGFRGPAEGGRVPVLSVDARALFTRSDPGPLVTMLKVGKGRGIRDMTVVRDGVLLLAGPDDDEANAERGWIVALWKNDELGRRDAEPEVLGMLDLSSVDRRDCDRSSSTLSVARRASSASRSPTAEDEVRRKGQGNVVIGRQASAKAFSRVMR